MLHRSAKPKIFQFFVVMNDGNKLMVPFQTNKTVNNLIEAVKERVPQNEELDTMYFVDGQSLENEKIFIILSGTERLSKILNAYKAIQSNDSVKLTDFYWFVGRSPFSILHLPKLQAAHIQIAPEEIRQKYHRNTPFLCSGFYFDSFCANQQKIKNPKKKEKETKSKKNNPNRGRYFTDNAMSELMFYQKAKNEKNGEKRDEMLLKTAEEELVKERNLIEYIPSYVDSDNCLFGSFHSKYLLILCSICRRLHRGELTKAHKDKLAETAKARNLKSKEFKICIDRSVALSDEHMKETMDILSRQNGKNLDRMMLYDCLVHLAAEGFEQNKLKIIRICAQFCALIRLSPAECAVIVSMFQTEHELLSVYRHLF